MLQPGVGVGVGVCMYVCMCVCGRGEEGGGGGVRKKLLPKLCPLLPPSHPLIKKANRSIWVPDPSQNITLTLNQPLT